MALFTITVNGRRTNINADADTPLLWVLRDTLGLTGTKFGCGKGLCGACTVHLDGEAIRSCSVTIRQVEGRNITTIEGLAFNKNNPVVNAWRVEEVAQCGYCQPGFIMTTAALLAKNSNPSDAEIDAAFSTNLCRCGSYQRIRKAVHRAAQEGEGR
jgi:isoquinoline 1-oxidoreductase subunit alpha